MPNQPSCGRAIATLGLLALPLASAAGSAGASAFLSNTLGDGMVLQRAPGVAVVFGVSNTSNATVTTMMGGTKLVTTAGADKVWRQRLPPTPTSGTLGGVNISFSSSAGETAQLTGVLFGDVFLCGGQSNMVSAPVPRGGLHLSERWPPTPHAGGIAGVRAG